MVFFLLNIFFYSIVSFRDYYKYEIRIDEFFERLGFNYNKNLPKHIDYLIHGASCGEIVSAIPIVNLLESRGKTVLVSSHTLTSYRLIKNRVNYSILKPYEHIINLCIFYYRFKPKTIIIMESDVWPIFICIAKLLGIRTISVHYKYKQKKPLRNLLHRCLLDEIYLREKIEFKHKKYSFLGNIKLLNNTLTNKLPKKKNLLVIVSAYKDELFIHYQLVKFCLSKGIQVVYIPRHLNYKDKIHERLNEFNYYWLDNPEVNIEQILNNNQFIVGFCYGLINKVLEYSKLAVIGGTFNEVQGHNILEPIIHYNYIIMGPNYKTIGELYDMLDIDKSALVSKDIETITNYILETINNYSTLEIKKNLELIENCRKTIYNKLITVL